MTEKHEITAEADMLPFAAMPTIAALPDGSSPEALKASFKGVVLLCADCEERSSGPKKLRVKDVRKAMKNAVRPAKGHLRVASTGCLGPCPKKAMTVAIVAGGAVSLRALRRAGEVDAVGAEALALLGEG
jgi:hypothetical protein